MFFQQKTLRSTELWYIRSGIDRFSILSDILSQISNVKLSTCTYCWLHGRKSMSMNHDRRSHISLYRYQLGCPHFQCKRLKFSSSYDKFQRKSACLLLIISLGLQLLPTINTIYTTQFTSCLDPVAKYITHKCVSNSKGVFHLWLFLFYSSMGFILCQFSRLDMTSSHKRNNEIICC